ncbi:MAG TPA: fluoride efflux transporter CrcB [Deinococcales bacterium]|nr:fluoride efflux transporter CrcB [Deinococcales bacterium]
MRLLWFVLAGAGGALARYLLGTLLGEWVASGRPGWGALGPSFPAGTLVINVLGSLVLAFVTTLSLRGVVSEDARLILGTGFCGAFTTFSTFQLETEMLLSRGLPLSALLYVGLSLLLGFAGILAGRALALGLPGPA